MVTIRIPDTLAADISGNLAAIAKQLEQMRGPEPSARYNPRPALALEEQQRRKALQEQINTLRGMRAQIDGQRPAGEAA
jgi:hypothetical protein